MISKAQVVATFTFLFLPAAGAGACGVVETPPAATAAPTKAAPVAAEPRPAETLPPPVVQTAAPTPIPTRPMTAEESKLAEAYKLLSKFRDGEAKRLIDDVLKTYEKNGDLEGLAAAYMVSADYYRYVGNEQYQKRVAQDKVEPGKVEPFPLYVILMAPVDARTAEESRRSEETYRKVIDKALAAKDHYKASSNYYRLSVLYMRIQRPKDACAALDDTLKEHLLGREVDPKHEVVWNRMRYPSFPDQIADTKKRSGCDQPTK